MQTLNHNIKQWLKIAGICIAVILLLAIVFRGCLQVNTHKDEKKEVEQINETVQRSYDSLLLATADSKRREDSLKQVTDKQAKQLMAANKEIDHSRRKIIQIASLLDSAKINRDTAQYMALADSLKREAVLQQEDIQHQQQLTASAFETYEQRLAEKDSTIKAQVEFISQMRSANADITAKYNSLHTDYGKVTRKLKGERTLGRVLGAAVLVAAGLFIAK